MAAPATLAYPSNYELSTILQVWIPEMIEQDPVIGPAGLFPLDTTEFAKVIWEQLDNFWGLASLRGIDGQPGRIQNVGVNQYEADPGHFGDVSTIREQEMILWRKPGDPNKPWDLSDLIQLRIRQLIFNALNRIRQMVWTLLTSGTFSVAGPTGVKFTGTFPIQTFATTFPWTNSTQSTPLNDYRSVVILHRGTSGRFDGSAMSFMNRVTFNAMDNNNNTADLFGRRTQGLETVEGLKAINYVLTKDDLPSVAVYDEGYASGPNPKNASIPSTNFVPFIANNQVVVIGKRPGGQRCGKVVFTRNATQLGAGGMVEGGMGGMVKTEYTGFVVKVVDHGETQAVGRSIDVGLSFNCAIALEYPSQVVAMNVGNTA